MTDGGWVCLPASRPHGTLYVGVTSDLVRRVSQHRLGTFGGFTARCSIHRPVWHERFGDIELAIARERTLKNRRRAWKVELIVTANPDWRDLAENLGFEPLR